MGCDMAVALGPSTITQSTFVGLNVHTHRDESLRLALYPAKQHADDETLVLNDTPLRQCRKTHATFGIQKEPEWGFQAGINEHGLAVGNSTWHSLLDDTTAGLSGPDYVRLVLERACTAAQAVDLLTNLISRVGQSRTGILGSDHVYLLTDGREAFVVEAAGHYWAYHEVHQVRAVSDVAVIRQDWNRISKGLADEATRRAWWTCDGSKIDFVGAISAEPMGRASALRRWGRATYLLESQNGAIDLNFFRQQLFADHYEDTSFEADPLSESGSAIPLCQHGLQSLSTPMTRASLMLELPSTDARIPIVWVAFGPPCLNVYFPVFLLPGLRAEGYFDSSHVFRSRNIWQTCSALLDDIGVHEPLWTVLRDRLCWLQQRMDMETDEFLSELGSLLDLGEWEEIRRRTSLLMQSHLEQFNNVVDNLPDLIDAEPESSVPTHFGLSV